MNKTGKPSKEIDRKNKIYIVITLACFVGVALVIISGSSLINNHIPEILRVHFGTDRYFEAETIDKIKVEIPKMTIADACNIDLTDCIENVLVISGEINSATLKSLEELSEDSLKIIPHTVCLNSIGGRVENAIMINKFINESGLKTCLASRYRIKDLGKFSKKHSSNVIVKHKSCYSACPLIIASSESRILLGDSFKLGVHSSGFKIMEKIHVDVEGEEYLKFLPKQMIPFFEFTQTVPSENMYILSDYQVRTSKLFNKYRGARKGNVLFKSLKNCESTYFISSKCHFEKVMNPYPETFK